ncbi:exopolyphosphatase / guanosine-5'-triphosphate,3'-diphosphate pyrophosphatase [Cyclonatronum proteinivorum]|uniref:Exopolyphosphatase / guanosine-5'-triphosphate,3'-diphosphate pyrophosphatase n=1 Tax=Cyclonatronum proteinivorum TaxID=1457365 RepID=A0A345UK79_9BACT|nr:Ppx/GppA family phosphatase [Cyclonatronum proteinivorum]AXJ00881.1 exopolyphosphatase / guanosine-5'-triphosphate,3'-diphosphate pyrophosphatase [Cyclonatronum proteinivorum]
MSAGADLTFRAAIDIGTNTVLLLIAEEQSDGRLRVIREEQRIPRLGRGVDRDRRLHPESMGRVIKVLREYRELIGVAQARYGLEGQAVMPVVTATSAVRDAQNRQDFLEEVKAQTGWEIRLLSGEEEASATYRGALRVLPATAAQKATHALVLDIGGGSTEAAFGPFDFSGAPEMFRSVDAGCVRFTERYLQPEASADDKSYPESGYCPTPQQIEACREAIADALQPMAPVKQSLQAAKQAGKTSIMAGVAGTVISLAFMELGLDDYSATAINGNRISLEQLQHRIAWASSKTPAEMEHAFPTVMEGRADIVLSGLLILQEAMRYFGFDQLLVSTGGIRHGVV